MSNEFKDKAITIDLRNRGFEILDLFSIVNEDALCTEYFIKFKFHGCTAYYMYDVVFSLKDKTPLVLEEKLKDFNKCVENMRESGEIYFGFLMTLIHHKIVFENKIFFNGVGYESFDIIRNIQSQYDNIDELLRDFDNIELFEIHKIMQSKYSRTVFD